MNEVFGIFILSEDNGNYKGEFFNNHLDRFLPENIRIDNSPQRFQGTFETEWEENGQQYFADLQISLTGNLYDLRWTNVRKETTIQNVTFTGTGVMKEERLLCAYRMNR